VSQAAWERELEPYVAAVVGVIIACIGISLIDSALATTGVHLWEPLKLLNFSSTESGRSKLIQHWKELALGSVLQFNGLALIWIGIRRIARRRQSTTR
jgi:hypothetical protein